MISQNIKQKLKMQGVLKLWITFSLYFVGFNCQVCGPPAVPVNSRVQTKSSDYGLSEATYECDTGYELFGPSTIKCDPKKGWEKELPFCGTNVAYRKPVNQSSVTRIGPAFYANDGKAGNQNPDGQECSETQKETSPWWRVDLLAPQTVRVVRITTRGCCGHNPLQDLEIRVGNSSTDLQKNPLCAWNPGTMEEGITKAFTCARPLIGQYVAIQLVGVEGSLSLCEVEVFSNDEFSSERCASPNLSPETILTTFSRTCYEFHVTRGESFDRARATCRSHGGDLLHDFRGATYDYVLAELDRRKADLKTQLVWVGAQKEPGITARTWRWVNGDIVVRPTWGKDQPNNYNGEQNCVVLDGGRNWLWNDVGCNLDYLHFICQHQPLSCGSPDVLYNTTIVGKNFSVGAIVEYKCPKEHSLVGNSTRECQSNGFWSDVAPTCKYIDCGPLETLEHGSIRMSEERTTFGAVAQYICHENYTLIGNENRTCTTAGWSGKHPQCLVDWCPEPKQISGGKIKISGRRAGSTVTYSCDHGYVLIGENILSCGLGGQWTGNVPTCRYVDCGTPARPDRGSLVLINGTTTVGSIVKYECDDDYWLVNGDDIQTCTKDGRWSGTTPSCELISCETPQVPTASYVVGYDYNVHSSITYHCDPGHVLKGDAVLKCLETGDWDKDPPICQFIDCKPLTQLPFGSIRYLQNTTYIGSEVAFSCVNTHRLNGNPKRICLETGLWSDSSPKCEEIRCAEPLLADHSLLSVTGNDRMYGRTVLRTNQDLSSSVQTYKVGALAKYRCERGYKIVGDALITCEENGQWSAKEIPSCVYVDCGSAPTIGNGTVTLTANVTYYGSTALYECNDNYKLDGVSRRICSEDGKWSGDGEPRCVEITCPAFNVSEHLIVDAGMKLVGQVAKFSCTKGRYLVGNNTRTCLSNGRWTGKNPVCKPVDCERPNEVENGRIIIVNDVTTYGGSAEYHCIPNYNRIGPYLRKCMEDGKWSGDEPRCELSVNEATNEDNVGTGVAISAAVIVILLIFILIVFLHRVQIVNFRNKSRPVKNSENVQAAERKEDQNAAVMSYSSLENQRAHFDLQNRAGMATFNTFQSPVRTNTSNLSSDNSLRSENIYDQIPNETTIYDQPYEMRVNEEMYEPEPNRGNIITINGISVR